MNFTQKRLFMNVSFFVRTCKNNTKNVILYCHITIDKLRTKSPFSTFIKVPLKSWCNKSKKIKGKNYFIENERLREIEVSLKEIYFELRKLGGAVSAEMVKSEFLKNEKSVALLECYDSLIAQKNKDTQSFINIVSKKNTLTAYLAQLKKLQIGINEVCPKFAKSYETWLFEHEKLQRNTVNRHLQNLKLVLNFAVKNDLIKSNPLGSLAFKDDKPKDIVFLTESELGKIIDFVPSEKLQLTKDVFLCLCYTGFSYSDLQKFDFIKDTFVDEGTVWISNKRIKTGVEAVLPLFDDLHKILVKYNYFLPVPKSNANFNKNLKTFMLSAGIDKKLTSHNGRKTFANRWLNKPGVSSDVVASMLGHDVGMLNKYYAKVNRSKIRNEVLR
jgi:integrase/recombinase XerD